MFSLRFVFNIFNRQNIGYFYFHSKYKTMGHTTRKYRFNIVRLTSVFNKINVNINAMA